MYLQTVELSEYVFQVDEEAEALQASILGCSTVDVTSLSANNKLTNKLTARTNGPLEGGGSVTQGTKSSTSSNEMTH